MKKSLSVFERELFEKKCARNKFLVLVKKVPFLAFQIFLEKCSPLQGCGDLNHLTHRYLWGINGKIISVAFNWYLVVLFVTACLVTIAS